jgi:hypothetical protein
MIRGSSSQANTPIFGEDVSSHWVVSGTFANPTLGPTDGNKFSFRVRNYPIVSSNGLNASPTNDTQFVSVSVNGEPVAVGAVDGAHGIISLIVPPSESDFVTVNYYFRRKDTRVTDDVSEQVSPGSAVIVAPVATTYSIGSSTNTLELFINDSATVTSVVLTAGSARTVSQLVSEINSKGITGLTAYASTDAEGLSHLGLTTTGQLKIGNGSANGAFGFNALQTTTRNKTFVVFNGPIVDGSDEGRTTTSVADVRVLVDNVPVTPVSVDGATRSVVLPFAPVAGSTVSVEYWYNPWQDTFDYLPNSNITNVLNVGIGPGDASYKQGADYVVLNDADQSKIYWGAAYNITTGSTIGNVAFDSVQMSGMLVDNRIFGEELSLVSTNDLSKWRLANVPTTGNGRDTPLSVSYFNQVTNGRQDLRTTNPNLVVAYVGKTWRDAFAKGAVEVLEVIDRTITLRNPVPADYKVYATYYYNRIQDNVTYTLSVITPGPSGIGQYSMVSSRNTALPLYNVRFGVVTGLSQTINWPSGVETNPDALYSGDGNPVAETVTITFNNALEPATHASITSALAGPYNIYTASRIFGTAVIDGISTATDLGVSFPAVLLGQPIDASLALLSTDHLMLDVDGVEIDVNLASLTSLTSVASAINSAIDADITVHTDGTGTFASTAPNNLASVVLYGSEAILKIKGRNSGSLPSGIGGGLVARVLVMPVNPGDSDASTALGLTIASSYGSSDALNQNAVVVSSNTGNFKITALNNGLALNVDGQDWQTTLPLGSSVTAQQVVDAINDSYSATAAFAASSSVAALEASLVVLANELRTNYNSNHRTSATLHANADTTNTISSPVATNLSTSITLLNELATKINAHLTQSGVHNTSDTANGFAFSTPTDLSSALSLAHLIQTKYNSHLLQLGAHGIDDSTNVVSTSNTAFDVGTLTPFAVSSMANNGSGLIAVTTTANHGLATGRWVNISGVVGTGGLTTNANGTFQITSTGLTTFDLVGSTFVGAYTSGGTIKSQDAIFYLLNDIRSAYEAHRVNTNSHFVADSTNSISLAALTVTTDSLSTGAALANQIKAKFNSHLSQASVHVVSDTTNPVTVSDASGSNGPLFESTIALTEALAYLSTNGAFNAHRDEQITPFHVHGRNDTTNTSVALTSTSGLPATVGAGANADVADPTLAKVVISSLTNTVKSAVTVKNAASGSTALSVLGLTAKTTNRVQPDASKIAAALNADATFSGLAVAYPETVTGQGTFLKINSKSAGIVSSLSFSDAISDTVFIDDTGIGIGNDTADEGEDAISGYAVSSSDLNAGSSGVGQVGQTYTDGRTGLRFTILAPQTGDYTSGGSFTLVCSSTFLCDSAVPTLAVNGVELTVSNTVGITAGTTGLVKTYKSTGNVPNVGDYYYISYEYLKSDLSTALYTDLKKIQANFGDPTPDNPLSLAARLAILNGAVVVGLKQVLKLPNSPVASNAAYIAAIDELKKPISGNIKPDIIVPLTGAPPVAAYLTNHVTFMSTPRQEGERTGLVGVEVGTTPTGVQAIAKGINSSLMSVVYPDSYVVTVSDNLGNVSDRLVSGVYMAAALAASTCAPSVDVATPWTRRSITGFKQVGRNLDPTTANQVAVSGVTVVEQLDLGNLRVRHGLTTNTNSVITRTPSVTLTIQYVQQQIRATLDPFIGQKFLPSIPGQVEKAVTALFNNLISAQIVNKVAGIAATVDEKDPTILRVEAIYVPVFPLEYIVVTLSIRIRT